MDIFISWSGTRSLAVAEALRDWLPMIINAAKPFLSVADIDKGARWSSEIATKLEKAKAGIICLTPGNVGSHWILFEAGALSKTVQNTYVCPLLIGLKPSDVKGPLAQFQFTAMDKTEMLQLFKTLNSALGDAALPETHLEKAFDLVWPKLEEQMKKAPPEEAKAGPQRSEREMLEEMLQLVRDLSRPSAELGRNPLDRDFERRRLDMVAGALGARIDVWLQSGYGDSVSQVDVGVGRKGSYGVNVATERGFRWGEAYPRELSDVELVERSLQAFARAYEAGNGGRPPRPVVARAKSGE